jgi:hypothetical protein
MTEVDALSNIASAIEHLANCVGGLGIIAFLTLILKSQSSEGAMYRIANMLEKWIAKH